MSLKSPQRFARDIKVRFNSAKICKYVSTSRCFFCLVVLAICAFVLPTIFFSSSDTTKAKPKDPFWIDKVKISRIQELKNSIAEKVQNGMFDEFDRSGAQCSSVASRVQFVDSCLASIVGDSIQKDVLSTILCNAERLTSRYSREDFQELGFRMRIYGHLFEFVKGSSQELSKLSFLDLSQNCVFNKLVDKRSSSNCLDCSSQEWLNFLHLMFLKMEHMLFDWTSGSSGSWVVNSLQKLELEGEARGIVLFGGDEHVPYLLSVIHQIREVHLCDLPIDVFYFDEQDLGQRSAEWISNSAANVRTVELARFFDFDKIHLKGWDGKPFVMLASRFKETIFIDADVVILQSPQAFFSQNDFQDFKAFFFNDRKYSQNADSPLYHLAFYAVPEFKLSNYANGSLTYRNILTRHEQESGVLVIDMSKKYLGVLAAAKLLDDEEKIIFTLGSHGEKECFWLGMEMMRMGYKFSITLPGAVGLKDQSWRFNGACGRLLHLDENDQPLWWNGGYKRSDKSQSRFRYLYGPYITRVSEEMWYDDGGRVSDSAEKGLWEMGSDFCVSESDRKPRRFEGKYRLAAEKATDFFSKAKKQYEAREFDVRTLLLSYE
jgi:hypothetical protein